MTRYCDIRATNMQEIIETCDRHIKNILITQYDLMEEENEEILARDLFYCNMFRDTWNDLREDILAMMETTPKIINSFEKEYDFLSNFYPCEINFDGIDYPSSEHAYQAAKSHDRNVKLKIAQLESPGKAKRYARTIEIEPNWDKNKLNIMRNILAKKFASGSQLHKKLKETGSAILIEGNTWGDIFWGMCGGKGKNHLGKILMEIRDDPFDEN